MNGLVRDALNIPKHVKWGGQSEITFNKLVPDFMKPATDIGKNIYTFSEYLKYMSRRDYI